MKMVDVPVCKCLACGCHLDQAGSPGSEATPIGGDITICFKCGHLMAFTDSLMLRELTEPEQIEIAGNGYMLRLQKLRARMLQ
jgi:hypothetical protein